MAAQAKASYPFVEGILRFNLSKEMKEANARRPWPAGLFSRTLLKERDMRLLLIMMEPESKMREHHADGSLSIQVLRGVLRMKAQAAIYDLSPGEILTLVPSIRHELEAMTPSALLLTLSWPESEKLQAMPHRGYGS